MSFFWPQNIKLENYGGFKKLLLLGLGVNTSHDCKPLKKKKKKITRKFPRTQTKMHPLTVLEWFPVKRECGWQERACSSVWAQNTVGLQSSHWVQEPHVTMPTLRTTQLFSSSACEEIILNKNCFDCCRHKSLQFLNCKTPIKCWIESWQSQRALH